MAIAPFRLVAAAAVVSGLSAAGMVLAEEKLGLTSLRLRRPS